MFDSFRRLDRPDSQFFIPPQTQKGYPHSVFSFMSWRHHALKQAEKNRASLTYWRSLRDMLVKSGLPETHTRLVLTPRSMGPFYTWEPDRVSKIYVPQLEAAHKLKFSDNEKVHAWGLIFMLLHEWGHALLHPPHDMAWAEMLSPETRYHAHPAWAQISEYPGWRVFNEMVADGFATAWLLYFSSRHLDALDYIRILRSKRYEKMSERPTINFPVLHATGPMIDSIWSLETLSPKDIWSTVLFYADYHFKMWLKHKAHRGEEVCAHHLQRLMYLDQNWKKEYKVMNIYGLHWGVPGKEPSQSIVPVLDHLKFTELHGDEHPLFQFSSVQKTYQQESKA